MSKRRSGVGRFGKVWLRSAWLCALFALPPAILPVNAEPWARNPEFSASPAASKDVYVMAPLSDIEDWDVFSRQLEVLKRNGVAGLTTDIWWGKFEKEGDNRFDWHYYLKYARTVRAAGLKWIPILSFHRCGGNVGDDCDVPLPPWVWSLSSTGDSTDLKFVDESGFVNGEYLSFWFEGAYSQYQEAMKSFSRNFGDFREIISKVYISLGPAGELRYPSYYYQAGWDYPERGKIQAYSDSAKLDFIRFVRNRYHGSVDRLNTEWRTNLRSFSEVMPPTDGDRFFRSGRYTEYGRDFLSWYQGVLQRHMSRMMALGREELSSKLHVPLGGKLAGIHWLHSSPETPRAAEYAAGYVDYEALVQSFRREGAQLTFTCLERDDRDRWTAPYYSAPRSLVREIAALATRIGVPLYGENALPIVRSSDSYFRVADAIRHLGFNGFTLLRMGNIVDEQGNETAEMRLFREIVIAAANGRTLRRVSDRPRRTEDGHSR